MTLQQEAETPSVIRAVVWPVIAYSVIYTLLFLIVNLLPLYTGVFIDVGGLSEVDAGWVNSTFLGAMTVAAIGFTFILARFSLRGLGFLATTIMVIGLCIPFINSRPGVVLFAMAIIGVGNGALFAIANAAAAMERYPVLVYGAGIVLSNLVTAAVPDPLYDSVGAWGVKGLFVPVLAFIPITLISLFIFKRRAAAADEVATGLTPRGAQSPYTPTAVALIAAVFLTNLFLMTYYAFADRVLVDAGYDFDAIATIFTIVYFVAALFGVGAMLMARWPRSLLPGTIALTALLAGSILVALTANSPGIVVAAVIAASGFSMINMSVQLGVAAEIDGLGRVAAAASGAMFGAWTIGPVLGGWLIEDFGFGGIAVLVGVTAAIGLALLFFVQATVTRGSTTERSSVDYEERLPAS